MAKQPRSGAASLAASYLEPRTDLQLERQRRVLDAIALKRKQPQLSLTQAAHRSGTTLKTIRRYAASAIEVRSGRLDVKARDRIPRTLWFLGAKGRDTVTVRNSRDASRIAKYHAAVRRAVLTFGLDTKRLDAFAGKSVRAGGQTYTFITDYSTIFRLARAGEIHFLDIYAK